MRGKSTLLPGLFVSMVWMSVAARGAENWIVHEGQGRALIVVNESAGTPSSDTRLLQCREMG
jgi:hypothetical protein